MANILVYIELDRERITAASIEALTVGRRIASGLGATLHAVLPCKDTPDFYGEQDVVASLSRLGADKVILATNCQDTPSLFATHGPALIAVCERFPPALVLFPAPAGGDLGPRVACHLQALYCPDARVTEDRGDEGRPLFTYRQAVYRRRFLWQEPIERHRPLVLTLAPSNQPADESAQDRPDEDEDEAEVVVVQAPAAGGPLSCELSGEAAAGPRVTIGGGAGLGGAESFELLRRLAREVSAETATSATARERGDAGDERPVGLDGEAVPAGVYLAFGVSGSDRHLAALDPYTDVVAVNTDAEAPIFRVARVGLRADAHQTLCRLVELTTTGQPRSREGGLDDERAERDGKERVEG